MPPSVTQRILTGVAVGIVIGVLIGGAGAYLGIPVVLRGALTGALVVGVLQVLRKRDRSANSLTVLLAASLFLGGCDGRTAAMSADNPFNTELNEPVAFGRVTANHVTEYARSIEASTVAAAA